MSEPSHSSPLTLELMAQMDSLPGASPFAALVGLCG